MAKNLSSIDIPIPIKVSENPTPYNLISNLVESSEYLGGHENTKFNFLPMLYDKFNGRLIAAPNPIVGRHKEEDSLWNDDIVKNILTTKEEDCGRYIPFFKTNQGPIRDTFISSTFWTGI